MPLDDVTPPEYDLTANFGLRKPWPGFDDDLWGDHCNFNFDTLDRLLGLADIYVHPASFGAILDGVADDTLALQAAADAAGADRRALFIPASANGIRTTATIYVRSGMLIEGVGVAPMVANGTRGIGSWLYFDHPGVGIAITPPIGAPDGTTTTGVTLRGVGTMRNQPADAPGWAPSANDFDVDISTGSVTIDDVMLWNATKGIRIRQPGNGYGRIRINGLRADCFQVGIDADQIYDMCQWTSIHFWCWWKDSANTRAYKLAHLDGFIIGRVDSIQAVNIFAISCLNAIRFVTTPAGVAQRMFWTNTYLDLNTNGIVLEAAANSTPTFHGLVCWSAGGATGYGIDFRGAGSEVVVSNGNFGNYPAEAVRLSGGNANTYKQSGGVFLGNDRLASGAPCINTTVATDRVLVDDKIRFSSPAGHALVGGAGAWFTTVAADRSGIVTQSRFAVDPNAYLTLGAGGPTLGVDAGDYFGFTRASNQYGFYVGSAAVCTIDTTQITHVRHALDANAYFALPAANPILAFDASDYFAYNRATNILELHVGGPLTIAFGAFFGASYANDAAAAAAGVPLNGVYRNGSQLMFRVA